jgi:hypothetical protein
MSRYVHVRLTKAQASALLDTAVHGEHALEQDRSRRGLRMLKVAVTNRAMAALELAMDRAMPSDVPSQST